MTVLNITKNYFTKEGSFFKMKKKGKQTNNGITLIALVITIVLNSSYLAMERMNKIEKI